ncbi:CGNR zinc finger domain-containing protein [Actinacidiphila acididurans]|uniref:CGNR zinc finger domain-containing protein n=1 Tax=Actinacidiphila acididurans TaxID=2784346 RepID=A0ABS2TIA8_9ACTN|nr:CGNR zinc finger domain-containing protein [Actinacidiphila acididurans]MBM9503068.1 CGNR zinc finger domain-containing protein [Actinacidiphila acididurans]
MSPNASERLGVAPAPDGLSAVQDFINTGAADLPDLLADTATAEQWFSSVLAGHAGEEHDLPVVFTERDLHKLVDLRSRLRQTLRDRHQDDEPAGWIVPTGVAVGLRQASDGTVVAVPRGTGWRLVASLLLTESLLAQQKNLWPRLKVCRNPVCRTAFYDRSRNNIGVWHDVLICGNAINLRTSRARRRAAATAADDPPAPSAPGQV